MDVDTTRLYAFQRPPTPGRRALSTGSMLDVICGVTGAVAAADVVAATTRNIELGNTVPIDLRCSGCALSLRDRRGPRQAADTCT